MGVFLYDESGDLVASGGARGLYCCDDKEAEFAAGGLPMQTCFAPIPITDPDEDVKGECLPGSCSAVGSRGSFGGLLGILAALSLLRGRRDD